MGGHGVFSDRAGLECVVNHFFDASRQHQLADSQIEESNLRRMVMHAVLDILGASRGGEPLQMEPLRAYGVCRSALRYLEDRLADDELPTISDLCRESRVSERTLQSDFQSYVNRSPQSYLRLCRLNRARVALNAPETADTTVTAVATRFGFFHLGKFAQTYRRQFGETPSTTLTRGPGMRVSPKWSRKL